MTTKPILKTTDLTKTYIIGKRKNAKKAQKAITKLHKKYEKECTKNNQQCNPETEKILKKAQALFAAEKYEQSYQTITKKILKKRRKDKGTVVHALNGVDLEIQQGELLAIMGPSGSGKSTLLNMMGLLDQPTAGNIVIHDKKVTAIKKRDLPDIRSNELGFVFQSFNLVPTLTALENVMLPLRYSRINRSRRKDMARKALEQVGLGDRLNHTPNELSGGQQQRVAVARSIVNNPSIIFGDELTGELDSKMTADVIKLIKKLNSNGQTFIIVTHNPDVAKECKRIIYMRDGVIEKQTVNK